MNVTDQELRVACDAIRRAGGTVVQEVEAWASRGPPLLVFVAPIDGSIGRGNAYDTWVITFAPDGSPWNAEQFRSAACGRR